MIIRASHHQARRQQGLRGGGRALGGEGQDRDRPLFIARGERPGRVEVDDDRLGHVDPELGRAVADAERIAVLVIALGAITALGARAAAALVD